MDTRLILPQSSCQITCDAYATELLHQAISIVLPPPPGTTTAGLSKTQVAEILAPVHKVIPDALDAGKTWAIVQQDVKQQYDTHDVLQIVSFLHSRPSPVIALAEAHDHCLH